MRRIVPFQLVKLTRAQRLFVSMSPIVIGLVFCVFASSNANASIADALEDKTLPSFEISTESLDAISQRLSSQAKEKSKNAVASSKLHPLLQAMADSPLATKSADGRMEVLVRFNDRNALLDARADQSMGVFKTESSARDIAQVSVNSAELAKLAASSGVMNLMPYIKEAYVNRKGAKTSQGDTLLKASLARSQFGVDGKGVSICVISDGVDNKALSQITGDLPATIEVCPDSPGEGDEGTAMLEIVHDLAPGAHLSFCGGLGKLFDAIAWSVTKANGGKGCDVVVDDLGNLTEPRFQISDETNLINRAGKELGTTYVSSAGNDAFDNYRAYFRDADLSGRSANAGFHDFGAAANKPSNIGFPVAVIPKGRTAVFLQWSEAFGAASSDFVMTPVLQGGKAIDAADSPFKVDLITDLEQTGKGVPLEAVVLTNNTDQLQTFFILMKRKTGRGLLEVSMLNNGNLGSFFGREFRTADGSIYGHAGAERAITVAAVDAAEPDLAVIEPFSSRGLVRTLFDNDGNRRFDVQFKPDVTATDGVDVTGVGGFPKQFFGTSASAPHVAAIAALVKNRNARANVSDVLKFSAVDRGSPGADTVWGFGLVDTQRALQLAPYLNSYGRGKSDSVVGATDVDTSDGANIGPTMNEIGSFSRSLRNADRANALKQKATQVREFE